METTHTTTKIRYRLGHPCRPESGYALVELAMARLPLQYGCNPEHEVAGALAAWEDQEDRPSTPEDAAKVQAVIFGAALRLYGWPVEYVAGLDEQLVLEGASAQVVLAAKARDKAPKPPETPAPVTRKQEKATTLLETAKRYLPIQPGADIDHLVKTAGKDWQHAKPRRVLGPEGKDRLRLFFSGALAQVEGVRL